MAACPQCGDANPDGARFCHACGSALAGSSPHEVRKTVTVLFADVTGSTALGEQLDPESFRRVIARYFEVARACLERHGGTVEKFIGDAVMAVFGVPTVHEDDALRALRAAAELRDELGSLNLELDREYGVSLQLRTGVNTGEVVTGTEERLATGDAVNVAARLEQAAQPEEILIGEETRQLARGAIEVEQVEPLPLKGKSEPVTAYRLLRVIEGAPAFDRRLDAPLVGRRDELAVLRAVFEATVAERRCLLVTAIGPPGIGKTRLSRELSAMLAGEAAVLGGRCLPYGEGITYWPLVEIFRAAAAEDELAGALSADTPEEIFWSVRKALERRAREQPIALVVDDIHWAEPTLLDLLEHLVDWMRDAPLMLLCLARPDLSDARPSWGRQPQAQTLTLEPLSHVESDELITGLLIRAELAVTARAKISDVAAGNPLFVEQLLAMFVEGGDPDHVPASIQALLAARLDALPDDEREVLEQASVIGLEFEWEALGELAPDRRRPSGPLLAALVRKDLVRPHEAMEDTFLFRHMLIRDAAYERLAKERRSELHERFAGWLDGRGEEFDEVIGYHLEQAHHALIGLGLRGDRAHRLADSAAERLAASGRRAHDRGDVAAAVNLLERASGLLGADDRRRISLLPSFGRALRDAGRMDDAEAVLAEAVEHARAAGERAIAADAGLALTDLRFQRPAQTGVLRQDVLREIDIAIQVFEEVGDGAGLARALTLGGKLRFWAGECAAAVADFERAGRYAREAGDRVQAAEIIQFLCAAVRHGPTPVEEGLARIEEYAATAGSNRRLELSCLLARVRLEAMAGRTEDSRDFASRAIAHAEEFGFYGLLSSHVLPAAGELELLAGDVVAAERLFRTACEGTERIGELGFLASITPFLVEALYAQGRDEEAFELSERWRPELLTVPEDVDAQAAWRRVRAKLLARRGEIEEGERLGREAVAIASATDFLSLRADALADLGEVLRLAGRSEEAAAALEEAIRLCEEKGNVVAAERLRARRKEPRIEA